MTVDTNFKPLYYFADYIHDDVDIVEGYIASYGMYAGEEDLLRIFENEIGIIETEYELKQWCLEYSADIDEVKEEYL